MPGKKENAERATLDVVFKPKAWLLQQRQWPQSILQTRSRNSCLSCVLLHVSQSSYFRFCLCA